MPRRRFDQLLGLARMAEPGLEVEALALRDRRGGVGATGPKGGPEFALARCIHQLRRRRELYFDSTFFSEPAWDLLLDLYAAAGEKRAVCVSRACRGSAVPPTTALRWLAQLESRGLIARESDQGDARRSHVRLTPEGARAMELLLRDVEVILYAETGGA